MAGEGEPRARKVGFRYIAGSICLAVLVWLTQWLYQETTPAEEGEQDREPSKERSTTLPVVENDWAGQFAFAGEPRTDGYPNGLTRLENLAYLVGYDEERMNPAWVAYRIPKEKLEGQFPRPTRFQMDSRTKAKATSDAYTGSGFDRGHMAPNHAIASRFGAVAQAETFLMSNIVPQKPAFNQGPWRAMEEVLGNTTALSCQEIWVIVGPVYNPYSESRLESGPVIPGAFFALVADWDTDENQPRIFALFMPKTASREDDFRRYQTTVDAIESSTGLDFFSDLPDEMEQRLESNSASYWLEDKQ